MKKRQKNTPAQISTKKTTTQIKFGKKKTTLTIWKREKTVIDLTELEAYYAAN